MSGSAVVMSIDVSKSGLDVAATDSPTVSRFNNEAESRSALVEHMQGSQPQLVVMEATDGYENAVACALQAAGFAVAA